MSSAMYAMHLNSVSFPAAMPKRLLSWTSALRTVVACLLFAIFAGCATSFSTPKPFLGASPPSAVYIYSFLDLREGILGPKFLAEVREQVAHDFRSRGIRVKQLSFNDSPLRGQFALQANQSARGKSSTRVPINEVIAENRADEASFNTSHRLIIFPIEVIQSNAYSGFHVRWSLLDAKTNQLDWFTNSYTQHQKWFLGDENPIGRAKQFVEAAIAEMEKAGVFQLKAPDFSMQTGRSQTSAANF